MQYTYLGNTGVKVSSLCFGTMSFGGDADEETSAAMFHRCREAGINFFDCANVYERGRSEEILGKLIRDCRDEVVLTTKVYGPIGDDVNAQGASRKHMRAAVEASLKRLGTDYIDIYFLHHFDAATPIEETLRVLDDLVRQGKSSTRRPATSPPGKWPRPWESPPGKAGAALSAYSRCTTWSNARPRSSCCPWPPRKIWGSFPTARSAEGC